MIYCLNKDDHWIRITGFETGFTTQNQKRDLSWIFKLSAC